MFLTKKGQVKTPANSFSRAVSVAKKMHEEHSDKPWFCSTKINKVNAGFGVTIVLDNKYANNIRHLVATTFKEDDIDVTFSYSSQMRPKEERSVIIDLHMEK